MYNYISYLLCMHLGNSILYYYVLAAAIIKLLMLELTVITYTVVLCVQLTGYMLNLLSYVDTYACI